MYKNNFFFSENSKKCLDSVDSKLWMLAYEVLKITPIDFAVTCGYRSDLLQQKLYDEGKSRTLSSKHSQGLAIDIVPCINGKQDFEAINECCILVGLFLGKASQYNINIRVGAIWDGNSVKNNSFIDVYHIELLEE